MWGRVRNMVLLTSLGLGAFSLLGIRETRMGLVCLGREEEFSHQLADFWAPEEPRGVMSKGPWWAPARLAPNLVGSLFICACPVLYYSIFRFRRNHNVTVLGKFS